MQTESTTSSKVSRQLAAKRLTENCRIPLRSALANSPQLSTVHRR